MKSAYQVGLSVLVIVLCTAAFASTEYFVITVPDEKEVIVPEECCGHVAKTGQTTSSADGDDGDLKKGLAWPDPRFTNNADGTVTDNLTGLIWMRNANCFGSRDWNTAISDCDGLADGSCGLSDGSSSGDWRLPNVRELQSLIHYGYTDPALSDMSGTGHWSYGDVFTGVQSDYYWSSTSYKDNSSYAWTVYLGNGKSECKQKTLDYYVWCVRDGE